MAYITVRKVPEELARALEAKRRERGISLNRLVIDLLARSLGVAPDSSHDNGLARLAGTWTAEDWNEFEAATQPFGEVDDELWR